MVRRLFAATLAAALVLLSPGLEATQAFAAVAVPKVVLPAGGIGGAAGASLPKLGSLSPVSLQAPNAAPLPSLLAAPAALRPALAPAPAFSPAPAAADAPRPAAYVPAMQSELAPALEAAADVRSAPGADRGNAQHIEDVITGRRSIAGSGEASVAGGFSSDAPALSAPADAPKAAATAPEAPRAPAVKVVDSRMGYALHRFMLSAIAALTGAVHSLPAAGPALTARAIKAAADKRVVISDFDDTLAAYNQTLSPEMVDAIRQVRAAGKHFAVISDRGDEKRAHQLTVFESLETLPVELRAGMYVAANAGGRVYRYDENGVPQRVYEAPALAEERKAVVQEAAAATKERMKALGAEQHDPVKSGNNNPAESWNTYGYAMMLKVGSSEAQVRGAASLLQEELSRRGIEAEVNPRFAKDPANPPYINFSIVTKQPATAYIAKALGATAGEVVIAGDSMYQPREAKKQGSFLDGLGAKLAGRAMPKTGNQTDRNMEKALPGALVLAVGHNADPRMSDAWVADVKGPETTRRMLLSVASKKAGAARKPFISSGALEALAIVALLAGVAAGGWALLSAVAEILVMGEQMMRSAADPFMMLGAGGLLAGSLKTTGGRDDKKDEAKKSDADKPLSRLEKAALAVLLPVAVLGALYVWYLLYAGFGSLQPTPIPVPEGWQGPLPNIRGIEDIFGAAGFAGVGMAGMLGARPSVSSLKAGLRKAKEFLRPAFPFLAWLAMAGAVAAVYGGLFYAFTHAPAAVPDVPVAPGGWESLFGTLGLGAGLGMAGMMMRPQILENPANSYAQALEAATKAAAERGVPAEGVLFVQATAVMPLHQGQQWHYQFALPRANGRNDLVYVDFERGTASGLEFRTSVYGGVRLLPSGPLARNLSAYLASRGVLLSPESALDALRAREPGFGRSVSVSLRLEQAEDLDLWYRYYDNAGAEAAVNARTGELRVAAAPAEGATRTPRFAARFKLFVVLMLAAMALYALLTGQAAAAAGLALASGALKKSAAGKATLGDDEVRSAAQAVISHKGRPWSQTEFNAAYYPALERLKAQGATEAQIALFEKLVAEAPIRGGSFNPWSGD